MREAHAKCVKFITRGTIEECKPRNTRNDTKEKEERRPESQGFVYFVYFVVLLLVFGESGKGEAEIVRAIV